MFFVGRWWVLRFCLLPWEVLKEVQQAQATGSLILLLEPPLLFLAAEPVRLGGLAPNSNQL